MSVFDYLSQDCFKVVDKLLTGLIEFDSIQEQYTVNITIGDKNKFRSCLEMKRLMEISNTFSEPMVWIGNYIAIASVFCILAMAADLFHGFRNRKFWFPCKYFSLDAASITVISVAMKLLVDLSSPMFGAVDQAAKQGSMAFMCMMMANLMPSLASMDNKTLLANIIGLAILVITLIVNISIQYSTGVFAYGYLFSPITKFDVLKRIFVYIYTVLMLLLLLILISLAITIPTSKKILKFKYQAISKKTLNDNIYIGMPRIEKLRQYVRRYWVMAESGSPQFVMASTPLSNACGIICVITLVTYVSSVVIMFLYGDYKDCQSDYKRSVIVIFITQSIGVVVGSIAPIFRSFTVLRFKLFTRNHFIVFKVEKFWTQKLCEWKESRLPFLSNTRRSRFIVYHFKNLILSLCIRFQRAVVVSCKMIGLFRIILVIIVVVCSYCWKSLKALLFTTPIASSTEDTHEDLINYVVQIQDEVEFAKKTVKDILNSMNRLIQKVKKEQHNDLLELLGKSTSFEGVEKFDVDQVKPLLFVEPVNSWSLPIVTLTCIAIALPNIRKDKVKSLLKGVGDGLSYTHMVEESLNTASEHVNVQRATMNLWHEVEDDYKWLGYTLKRNDFKGKISAEVLKWFADKAQEIVMEIKESTNGGELMDGFPNKLIAANSMYRIAETFLFNYQRNIKPISEDQLFELLSCMISDILCACLTNIPRAIETKCHESVTILKPETSVEGAAKLLGRSMEIIEKLEACELPTMDPDKMAFIDEWRLHLKRSIP